MRQLRAGLKCMDICLCTIHAQALQACCKYPQLMHVKFGPLEGRSGASSHCFLQNKHQTHHGRDGTPAAAAYEGCLTIMLIHTYSACLTLHHAARRLHVHGASVQAYQQPDAVQSTCVWLQVAGICRAQAVPWPPAWWTSRRRWARPPASRQRRPQQALAARPECCLDSGAQAQASLGLQHHRSSAIGPARGGGPPPKTALQRTAWWSALMRTRMARTPSCKQP